jgi:hypothetical protein
MIAALRDAAPADHKFFERHSRSALTDGLYSSAVVLVEGPTEAGGLTSMWEAAFSTDGLDERRLTVIDCESIGKMESYARFYKATGVPTVAICDCDPQHATTRKDIVAAGAELLITWKTHDDWEGVLGAEADIKAITGTMNDLLADTGGWSQWGQALQNTASTTVTDPGHVAGAGTIGALVDGYAASDQRQVLTALLRSKTPSWKSAREHRRIAGALPAVPRTFTLAMLIIHQFADGNPHVAGIVDL